MIPLPDPPWPGDPPPPIPPGLYVLAGVLILAALVACPAAAQAGTIRDSIEPVVWAQAGFKPQTEVEKLREDVDRHTTLMIQGGIMAIGVVVDMGSTESCVSEFPTQCSETNNWGWMQTNGVGRVMMQLGGGVAMVGINSLVIRWGYEWVSWLNTAVFTGYKFWLFKRNTDVLNDLRRQFPGGDPSFQPTAVLGSDVVGLYFDGRSISAGFSW